jgi:hypothetical protein
MFSLAQDLRFALRQLRKSPGYALVATLTLSPGIGANTAIFLLTWSILLKSLPVPHPGELVHYRFNSGDRDIDFSYPLYETLRAHQSATTGVFAAFDTDELSLQTTAPLPNPMPAPIPHHAAKPKASRTIRFEGDSVFISFGLLL